MRQLSKWELFKAVNSIRINGKMNQNYDYIANTTKTRRTNVIIYVNLFNKLSKAGKRMYIRISSHVSHSEIFPYISKRCAEMRRRRCERDEEKKHTHTHTYIDDSQSVHRSQNLQKATCNPTKSEDVAINWNFKQGLQRQRYVYVCCLHSLFRVRPKNRWKRSKTDTRKTNT